MGYRAEKIHHMYDLSNDIFGCQVTYTKLERTTNKIISRVSNVLSILFSKMTTTKWKIWWWSRNIFCYWQIMSVDIQDFCQRNRICNHDVWGWSGNGFDALANYVIWYTYISHQIFEICIRDTEILIFNNLRIILSF